MIQRREIAAKVINGDTHMAVRKPLQNRNCSVRSFVEGAFGSFNQKARWIGTACRQGFLQVRDQVGMIELPSCDVERESQIEMRCVIAPGADLAAYCVESLPAEYD